MNRTRSHRPKSNRPRGSSRSGPLMTVSSPTLSPTASSHTAASFNRTIFVAVMLTSTLLAVFPTGSALAQNTETESHFPFSWAGATSYSLDVASFVRPGDSDGGQGAANGADGSAAQSNVSPDGSGSFSYVTDQIRDGYFSRLGVDALILKVEMQAMLVDRGKADMPLEDGAAEDNVTVGSVVGDSTVLNNPAPAQDSSSTAESTFAMPEKEKCALYGNEVQSAIGSLDSFSALVLAAHKRGIRVALSIDAARWCGDHDAAVAADWVEAHHLDGIQFESAELLPATDLGVLRTGTALRGVASDAAGSQSETASVEKVLDDFWIGGVFPDIESTDRIADTGSLTAASISGWQLNLFEGDSLSTLFRRAVKFAVEHPSTTIQSGADPVGRSPLDQAEARQAATRLLLQPGAINITAGDEGAQPGVVEHWQVLGSFRHRHPAVGGGAHEDISESPYMFYRGLRIGPDVDQVLIVLGATGQVRLSVSQVFEDDTVLRDAYTGKVTLVSFGQIRLNASENGVILLEEVR